MYKTIFKILIQEKQAEIPKIQLVQRAFEFDNACNYVLVGARRAGKSFLLFQHIQQLLASGRSREEEILYINFEDERLAGLTVAHLHLLLDAFKELFDERPRIFLDEIQVVAGWEKFVRRLADSGYRVMVTGSNAQMLSREIYSTLGARFNLREVFPFSFKEFLDYKQVKLNKNWETNEQRFEIRRLFDEYFVFGGFSQAFALQDKREWLNGVLQKVLLGDIAERYKIRAVPALQLLCRKLAENVMQATSQSRLTSILAAAGTKVGRESVAAWLDYMANAYLIFGIPNFAGTFVERAGTPKRYFIDNAFLSNYLIDPQSRLLENLVAITLKKRVPEGELFFYKKNVEIDFYLPNEKTAIQVACDISDLSTRERETRALVLLAKAFDVKNLQIITLDSEEIIEVAGFKIEVLPIWKWLLS